LYIKSIKSSPPEQVFKLPLPGGKSWLLTTEAGGNDCASSESDRFHEDSNHYSLDFSSRTLENNKMQEQNVKILASAGGKVTTADYTNSNGYYVVIDHDYDGDVNTGFTTRYLHLAGTPTVKKGDTVVTGQMLGIMGNTGYSQGVHLHFGIRYKNNGNEDVKELKNLKLDGVYLYDYLTHCTSGVRNDNSYYYSTNSR
jgi:hypothetical protein